MGLSKAFYRHYQKIEPGLICNVKDTLCTQDGSQLFRAKAKPPPTTLFCEFDTTGAGISGGGWGLRVHRSRFRCQTVTRL